MMRHLAVLASPAVLKDPQIEARTHFQRLAAHVASSQRPPGLAGLPFVPARIKTSKPNPMQRLAAGALFPGGGSPRMGSPRVGAAGTSTAMMGSVAVGSPRVGSPRVGAAGMGTAMMGSVPVGSPKVGAQLQRG